LFEWDESKRQRNIEEHGVDFRLAALIFVDQVVEAEDERDDYGETRYRALGRVGDEQFVVVYTSRGASRRSISARKVDEHGKKKIPGGTRWTSLKAWSVAGTTCPRDRMLSSSSWTRRSGAGRGS
jgi:uncharacterized DUF497 family protein